jgi:hypothetical protein
MFLLLLQSPNHSSCSNRYQGSTTHVPITTGPDRREGGRETEREAYIGPNTEHLDDIEDVDGNAEERSVTPGFKGKSECKNTCAPGSSYTHASTQ